VSARSCDRLSAVLARLGDPDKRDDRDANDPENQKISFSPSVAACALSDDSKNAIACDTLPPSVLRNALILRDEVDQETDALGRTKVLLAVVVHRCLN
jgi:hypothetical protein